MARSTSRNSRRPSQLIIASLTVLVGLFMLAIGVHAQSDSGRYAQIQGTLSCAKTLEWTVTLPAPESGTASSNDATAPAVAQVGHDRVAVQYRLGSAPWQDVTTTSLNADNGYVATGTLALDDDFATSGGDATTVDLQVVPEGAWADGSTGSQPRFAQVPLPDHCNTHPIDVELVPECGVNAVAIHLRHVGIASDPAAEMRIDLDGAALRSLTIAAQEQRTLTLPLQPAMTRTLVIAAVDGPVVFHQEIRLDCSDDAALIAPVVLVEYCPQSRGEFLFTMPGTYDVQLDGISVHTIVVDTDSIQAGLNTPSALHRVSLELPVDREGLFLEVIHDETVVLGGDLDDCTGDSLGISTVEQRPLEPVAELEAEGTIVSSDEPTDAVGEALPETGLSTLGIAAILAGLLLLLGGGWALMSEIRKPRPAVLGPALAPYQKAWWGDPQPRQ